MTVLLPTASRRETWRALRGLVRGHRLLALAALTVLLVATVAGLLVPPVLGDLVDRIVGHRGPSAVTSPFVLLAALALVQGVGTGWGGALVARLGETTLARLRERVVERTLALPLERVEQAGSGDVVARVSGDVGVVAGAVRSALPALADAGLTVSLTVLGLAALDWRFAVAGLLAAPIQLHTVRWYLRTSTPVFAAEREAEGARAQQLLESLGGARTVRELGLTEQHVAAARARSADAVRLALGANRLATRFYGRLNLAELLGLGAILCTGFWLVRDGAASVGAAAAAALYFHRLFDPINTLLGLVGEAQQAAAALARLVGVADAPLPEPADPRLRPADGCVEVRAAVAAYGPGHPVLHEVDLRIEPDEHVALVGPSGAGKTTLARLVAGVHPAAAGEVRVGGVAVGDLDADMLRAHVALVTQETHVFAGTLADDLRLAAPGASDDDLHAALAAAQARDWVDALPDGLHTVVGAAGHSLDPTQAQQVALARVLLADPAIVLLDEASADAGSAGARVLDRAAAAVVAGRTALVVAHRLSQAAQADRVVVLDGGRVVEQGTHDVLCRADGVYAGLWSAWAAVRAGSAQAGR